MAWRTVCRGEDIQVREENRFILRFYDGVILRVFPKGIGLYLDADKADGRIVCRKEPASGSGGDGKPIAGGKFYGLPVDNRPAFSLKNCVDFFIVLVGMDKRESRS